MRENSNGRRRAATLLSVVALGLGGACSSDPDALVSVEGPAEVLLARTNAPSDVACVVVELSADRVVRRTFDVVAGGSTVFVLSRLSTGRTVINVDAFPVACSAVAPDSVPSWTGGPVSVTLAVGVNGTITVPMRPFSRGG